MRIDAENVPLVSPWWWFLALVGAVCAALLVPFVLFGPAVDRWYSSFEGRSAATWLVAWIVVALLAVDIVVPVPSSVVAAFAGVTFGAWVGSLLVFVGLSLSCALGYLLASSVRAGMQRRRWGASALRSATSVRVRHSAFAIVAARPIPLLAEATVVVAALTPMRRITFVGSCCAGNLVVTLIFAVLPALLG